MAEGSQRPTPRGSWYTGAVGFVFVILVGVAVINGVQTDEGEILGADPTADAGTELPRFALPDVTSDLEGDANIVQDSCEVDQDPCPEDRRRTAACDVDLEGAIRVCDLFDRPLVLSFWFTRGSQCLETQDSLDELARRYGDRAGFLSVNVRDEREEAREIVAERGWKIPVGHDRDGAVSNIYRVGVCPSIVFAYPGGIQMKALVGADLKGERLERAVTRLIEASRRREER